MGDQSKASQGDVEASKVSSERSIKNLPLAPLKNYSPHFGLEFDLAVQEYCRNRSNHIMHKKNTDQSLSKQKLPNAYDSITTPFNKIVRNCKVVVCGDVAVGKTCLCFGNDAFSTSYQTTIGVDFNLQRFNILDQPYVLQIWDTAGQERFKGITRFYYRGCQAILLLFDMSNMNTLANVMRWKDEVLSAADQFSNDQETSRCDSDSPLLFLVGTKCDLPITEPSRLFITEQANRIATKLNAELWFVSSRTGENVNELFSRIAALSFNRCIMNEMKRIKFENSTIGNCLKEKIMQQQKELSNKLIKITKKKQGDDRRTRCVNVQCVIK